MTKKILICVLSLLLAVSMLLTGCNGDDMGNDTDKQTADTQSHESESDSQAQESKGEFIKLPKTVNLLAGVSSNDVRNKLTEFKTEFEQKTGVTLRMVNSSAAQSSFEILVGKVSSREQSTALYEEISYAECVVKYKEGKLMLATYNESMIETALDAIIDRLVKNDDGSWGIQSNISYVKAEVSVSDDVPIFDTAKGKIIEGVKSNDGYITGYTSATVQEYDAYCQKLAAAGYTQHAVNNVKDNKYATYVTENTLVHISWQGVVSTFRIFISPKTYVPATTAPTYEKVAEPTVAQLACSGSHGMWFVIQLEDGSFIVIDGGTNDAADKSTLLNYLRSKKPASHDKPHVNWIFTHPHSDHIGLALSFLETYYNEIHLDMVSYNFPTVDALTWAYVYEDAQDYVKQSNTKLKNLLSKHYRETEVYVHHTGQKLLLAGCEIEFVFTQEDWWPNACQTFNDTCSGFKMTFSSGHSFLVLGDLDEAECNHIAAAYGDYVNCDVFQPTHHGQKGGTKSLYELLDPTYVLWANTKKNCTTTVGSATTAPVHCAERGSFNPLLFNNPNVKGHYHREQTVIINMRTLTATDAYGNTPKSFWPIS